MNLQQGAAVACSLSLSLSLLLSLSLHDRSSERPTRVTVLASCCGGSNCVNFPATKICQECGTDWDLSTSLCYLLSIIYLSPLSAIKSRRHEDNLKCLSPSPVCVCVSVSERCKFWVCSQRHREDVQFKVSGWGSGSRGGSRATLSSNLSELLEQLNCLPCVQVFISLQTAR